MQELKKISIKKLIRFVISSVLVTGFLVALVAASDKQNSKLLQGMEVSLNDEREYSFLQKKDIETLLLSNRNIDLTNTTLDAIDLREMERIAKTNPWVSKAEVYIDNRKVLKVHITQREPVARVFDEKGSSYYLDSQIMVMPAQVGYAFPAPVFTNVPVSSRSEADQNLKAKIAYVSRTISADSFWRAQAVQIEVADDHSFSIIPLLGNQTIRLGDTSRLKEKLHNLYNFYKNVSAKIGWDKYEVLDARFKGQIVASPALGWKPATNIDTVARQTAAVTLPDSISHVAARTVAPAAVKPEPVAVAAPKVSTRSTAPATAARAGKVNTINSAANATKETVNSRKKTEVKQSQATKKDTETKKETRSPKYIYPGQNPANH